MSDAFKSPGKLRFLRKGHPLPSSETLKFNEDENNIRSGHSTYAETDLATWFDGSADIELDEEIVGLGSYGYTLTVLSSETLPEDAYEDEEEKLIESWAPKFAYKR